MAIFVLEIQFRKYSILLSCILWCYQMNEIIWVMDQGFVMPMNFLMCYCVTAVICCDLFYMETNS
jgi:hypothetical protein